jgi:GTPase SAR1 family protein
MKISILSLPTLYREKLKKFIRLLIHEPKYISSVFGAANVGKSTLLTEVMQNIREMKEVYEIAEQHKSEINVIFPSNSDPLTFYDSFYVFNEDAKKLEYAKDLRPEDVLL